jgi:hypothetical protein
VKNKKKNKRKKSQVCAHYPFPVAKCPPRALFPKNATKERENRTTLKQEQKKQKQV